jgi:tRNA U38,U39,U40 pseudouridine synthase TruA
MQVSWSRAARTDKGVSAVGNVVSVKLKLDQVETQ